jgi:hypothetical protein
MESTMKYATMILGALILLATIGSAKALAAELPKEILGVWCGDGSAENLPWGSSNDQRSCRKQGPYGRVDLMITINPRQYIYRYEPNTNGFSYTCAYTAITTRFHKDIIYTTKEMGVTVTNFTADCKEDEAELHYGRHFRCTWQERGTFYVSKGGLYMEQKASVRKGNERCARSG